MNAYLIRLELLKMAKDLLMEEYHSKRSLIEQEWSYKISVVQDHTSIEAPKLPRYPTEHDIINKALGLNNFISNG